jgi:hypothetical protein
MLSEMSWLSITSVSDAGGLVTHIVPIDDTHDHELSSECWCDPKLDEEHWVATHQSADGREDFESGARKPS